MSLTNSSGPAGRPDPSLQFCSMNQSPTLDKSGMHGKVCRVNRPPALVNFSSCCDGQWRVRDNCTQYCEVADWRDFGSCVNHHPERTNGIDWEWNGTFGTVCTDVDEERATSTEGDDGDGEGEEGEESGAGKFSLLFSGSC